MVDGSPAETVEGLRPGQVLAGKYRIDETLGSGGMGVVVAAYHVDLDEKVAIKFLRPEGFGAADVLARFAREARASRKIKSEYVARIYDVGKLDDGTPYMVMEYLQGEDLSQRLHRQGLFDVERAVSFILQACEALADAHALGIVHRDLKPANLFVVRRTDGSEAIKVLDFGISKASPTTGSNWELNVTRTATVLGSPLYMSPEQMKSARDADARSDIWSLGSTLYELLVGVPPFEGDTITELCARVASDPAPNANELRGDVPPKLARVIQRCLEKAPALRFQNVAELAAALADFAGCQGKVSAERAARVLGTRRASEAFPDARRAPGGAVNPIPSRDSHGVGSWARTFAPALRRPRYLATVGGVVVSLSLLAYALLRPRSALPTDQALFTHPASSSYQASPTHPASSIYQASPTHSASSPSQVPTPQASPTLPPASTYQAFPALQPSNYQALGTLQASPTYHPVPSRDPAHPGQSSASTDGGPSAPPRSPTSKGPSATGRPNPGMPLNAPAQAAPSQSPPHKAEKAPGAAPSGAIPDFGGRVY